MQIENLKNFISGLEREKPNNCVNIFFSRRTTTKYISYSPSVSTEVQQAILDTILPSLKAQLSYNAVVNYNPIGVADNEIETMPIDSVALMNEYMTSIDNENIFKKMEALKIDKIGFYCVRISYNGIDVLLFRQFQKLKKLRKGLITQILNNELNVIESDFLGIDETVDIVYFQNELLLLNHIALERIFEYKDEYLKKTNEAINEIKEKNVIENIEQFSDDCSRDVRITKRFTHIMTKGRLPLFFENYEKVAEIVKRLELDIDFDHAGKLIYREKSQLFHIINLLSDSYFESLLANRTGIAKSEEEI